ncbi:MAG: DUF5666 domain-containing protein [Anaerolineales bacterium]|jgi:hypothetical protein
MDTTPQKSPKIWPFFSLGCALLILSICGASVVLGAGGALWFTHSGGSIVKQGQPPSSQLSPEVAELTGLLGWVEVKDQGKWAPASEGQLVRAGQRVRTGEMSKVTLRFYDGSQAFLGEASELSIDDLGAARGNRTRTVVLTQWTGQSEHQVAKNGRKDSRYVVNTAAGAGEAHGTLFRVFVTPQGEARYMVVEGTIAVTSLEVTVLVNAGQVTAIYLGEPPLEPVTSVSAQGEVTQTGDTWEVAGQSFTVNEHTMIVGDPQVGDWALVEGRLLDDGSRIADWIILIHASQANHFGLNGEVDATGETEWTINDQKIYVTSDTEVDPGIEAGDLVRVEGLILEDGRLEAGSIRLLDSKLGLPFEFTGVIQEMNAENWLLSGHSVRVTAETTKPDDLSIGQQVTVRGNIQEDETWLASSITRLEQQAGHFEFSGVLESMDPWQVAGISFETRDWTVIAPDLKVGDLVFVEGEVDSTGTWIAEEVVRLDAETARLVLIGTLVSKDPWIVSGVTLQVTTATEILGEVSVGSLVRVELVLGGDGQWYALRIEPLPGMIVFPSCIDLVAKVVSVTENQIQLANWPLMPLDENAQVDGVITPNSVVRFRLCFNESGQITIVYIVIIQEPETEPVESGGKVLVCHKPDKKKGGHTLSIDASALPAHLGHGDYAGPCR